MANNMPKLKTIGIQQPETAYIDRYAVRIVALNPLGDVAIIYVKRGNYLKLPGGGIEINEDHHNAAQREVEEETGAVVSLRGTGCIATTEEFRSDLHQISYCYLADVLDTSGNPSLTEEERIDGLSHQWLPINKAIEAMTSAEPTSELGRYIQERDVYLLTEVRKVLEDGHEQVDRN
ncbi:hypothetical protein M441DRAFT_60751 [Trichoderma asperellum CBS 433.97]|uniref:Nudix hydrolase domain-containing protein n=2 Tax=Trichoderma asperellum TaxID=101201 RepID=A0A2T3YYA7_TRIA4|nr:hypothetical protein M441DRAFT_60751 [Trichoderma asperellum CBS 433.97]PTB37563.1 hypothetical protein M441DRAFT_60751 [Trichoderma asperellum CBS 433.97]